MQQDPDLPNQGRLAEAIQNLANSIEAVGALRVLRPAVRKRVRRLLWTECPPTSKGFVAG